MDEREHQRDLARLFAAQSFIDTHYSDEEIEDFKGDLDCLRTHYESYMASNIDVPVDELPDDVQQWLDEVYSGTAMPTCTSRESKRPGLWREILTGLFYIFAIVTILNFLVIAARIVYKII